MDIYVSERWAIRGDGCDRFVREIFAPKDVEPRELGTVHSDDLDALHVELREQGAAGGDGRDHIVREAWTQLVDDGDMREELAFASQTMAGRTELDDIDKSEIP